MTVPTDIECGVCGLQAMNIASKGEYDAFVSRHHTCAILGSGEQVDKEIHEDLSPLLHEYIKDKQFVKGDVVVVAHRNDPLFDLPQYDEREYSVYHMQLDRLVKYLRANGAASKHNYPFPEQSIRDALEWVFETADTAVLFTRDSSVLSFPLPIRESMVR